MRNRLHLRYKQPESIKSLFTEKLASNSKASSFFFSPLRCAPEAKAISKVCWAETHRILRFFSFIKKIPPHIRVMPPPCLSISIFASVFMSIFLVSVSLSVWLSNCSRIGQRAERQMFDNDLILIQLLKQTQSQLPHESTKNFEKNE